MIRDFLSVVFLNLEMMMTFRLPPPNWPIEDLKCEGHYFYESVITELRGSRVEVEGRGEMLMFSSYSYLDLLQHPRIDAAAIEAIRLFGTGTHGVRLLAGTTLYHKRLEARIAAFKQTEAAMVLSNGFLTNATVIDALVGRGDYVISDKLNHASIVDGCQQSGARFLRFDHNDIGRLDEFLQTLPSDSNKLVIADAVFSMDGDIFNLPAAVEVCRRRGAFLMIDEAHSLGVIGKTGRGIEQHFAMPSDSVDVKMGTLSKAIPCIGGYIAGRAALIEVLKHRSRGYIYSASLPVGLVAAAEAAFDVLEEETWRVERLHDNDAFMKSELHKVGLSTHRSETAVIPIMCGTNKIALDMAKLCQEKGLFIQAITAPVVPEGEARLRCIVTAAHSREELRFAASVIATAARELGVVP
ncbi:8-amino-7-oxononanoate synthase [Azospirillaceae bacterium]